MLTADERPERLKTIAWWLCLFTCTAAFALHFFMIEMWNLPQNFLSVRLRHQVDGYVHPLFTQNWKFFAPTPIDNDVWVIARVRACPRPDRCTTSDWQAITVPLMDSVRHNRFSSLGVVQIMLDNAALNFHNSMVDLYNSAEARMHHRHRPAVLAYSLDPSAAEVMLRTSVAAIQARYPHAEFDKIQIGLYVYHYPRFSHRREPDRPERDGWVIPIEWKSFPKHTVPFVS